MLSKSKGLRPVDILVLSDIHLGTFGCRSEELLTYLRSIQPKRIILNGDIVDAWQFNKHYFPKSHMKVIKHFTSLMAKGVQIDYVTGNHDEVFRKFSGLRLGSFTIHDYLSLNIGGKKTWIFHGDVFDISMQYSKWFAKLGGMGYDLLIMMNTIVNWVSNRLGKGRISLSKRVKNSVKSALVHINRFEETIAEIGINNQYDIVICGHIHHPIDRVIEKNNDQIHYLNSGDWIENCTALEYHEGEWQIYQYEEPNNEQLQKAETALQEKDIIDLKASEILSEIYKELTVGEL